MAIIKRLEITFNHKETDLLKHIESQTIPSATYIKQLLRDDMNSDNTHVIDYLKIKQIIQEVISTHSNTPNLTPNKQQNNNTKLLQNFAKKH